MAQTVQPVRSLGTNHVEMHLAAKAGKDRKEVPRNNHDSPFDNSLHVEDRFWDDSEASPRLLGLLSWFRGK